ncbi:MAG: FHA domain-containing protein [Myxococcota bacterium]
MRTGRIVQALATLCVGLCLLSLSAATALAGTKLNIDYVDATDFLKNGKIRFYVDLLDDKGRVIEDLDGDEVSVFIDEEEVPGTIEVLTYEEANERLAVAMLLAGHHGYVPQAEGDPNILAMEKEGFAAFVNDLDTNDKVTAYFYDNTGLQPVVDWRDAGADVADSIMERVKRSSAAEEKGTAAPDFYKLVGKMLDKFDEGGDGFPRRQVLYLMSDGFDKRAQKGAEKVEKKIRSISEAARDKGVKIYTVGFTLSDPTYLVGLGSLASKTGGVYRSVKAVGDIQDALEGFAAEFKKQYVLDFTPNDDFEGKEKKAALRIELVTPKGENLNRDYDTKVTIQAKPFKWWLILVWIGGILGGLGLVFLIIKLVSGMANRRPAPVADESYEGPYKGRLSVVGGPYAGQEFFVVDDETTIGSIDGNSIVIPGGGMSRRHAGIHVEEMRFELADFGSTCGTFVNGNQITKTFLRDSDEIRLGEHVLKFTLK